MSELWFHSSFDDPAMLRGSATSCLQADRSKHLFQYMCENGHLIMRNPVPLVAGLKKFNIFKIGFAMGRNYPAQLNAYLALGARHLSHSCVGQPDDAQIYYSAAVHHMRNALIQNPGSAPPEWMCATAALLAIYEVRPSSMLTAAGVSNC